jgi:hypothetical protein
MKRIIPLLLTLTLSACFNGTPAIAVPDVDRVHTVNEYLADRALREKVSTFCSNDPGRTLVDANCMNVRRADHIALAGTTIPKIDTSLP